MNRVSVFFFVCLFCAAAAHSEDNQPAGLDLSGTLYEQVAQEFKLDPLLLYSVALLESATKSDQGGIAPYPYVIRTTNWTRFYDTESQARAGLKQALLENPNGNIDVGMFQINLIYHAPEDPYDLLDPEFNARFAAPILVKAIDSSPKDFELGIGRYHSYRPKLARIYGRRALAVYENLKALN